MQKIPSEWCAIALPSKPNKITLVSVTGYAIPSHIQWGDSIEYEAYVTRGWSEFCHEMNFRKDNRIEFGVRWSDDNTLYMKTI